jgi:hypothetical protein
MADGNYHIHEPIDKSAGELADVSLGLIARRNNAKPLGFWMTYVCNPYAGRAFTPHGDYPLIRQQLNRVGVRRIASETSNRGMASACVGAWSAGFLFFKASGRCFYRWMLLALVSQALANALEKWPVVAGQARSEQSSRSAHRSAASRKRYQGIACLGTRPQRATQRPCGATSFARPGKTFGLSPDQRKSASHVTIVQSSSSPCT